mgnify:CR=1 FL=1
MSTEEQQLPPFIPRLQPPELAADLGLTTYTLQRYRCEGTGPEFEKIGNRIFYRADVVEAWRQAKSKTSTSDTSSDGAGATDTQEDDQPPEQNTDESQKDSQGWWKNPPTEGEFGESP